MKYWKGRVVYTILAIAFLCAAAMPSYVSAGQMKTEDLEFTTIGETAVVNGRRIVEYGDNTLLKPQTKKSKKRAVSLPAEYETKHTSVKNQGSTGTCWAFGTLASLESGMIVEGNAASNIDFSEWHLVYFSYHGQSADSDKSKYAGEDSYINNSGESDYQIGGSRLLSAPTLFRWYGAVDDTVLPFSQIGQYIPSEGEREKSAVHLLNAVYLPEINQTNSTHSDATVESIKQKIYEQGAVSAGYYSGSTSDYKYHNEDGTTSYYYSGDNYADHEISIVGWDDDYCKENFSQSPPEDGAFLVKNSWGSGWGEHGYFYLSYYDTTLSEPTFYEAEKIQYQSSEDHIYQNVYQYDGAGFGDFIFSTPSPVVGVNKYTARSNEKAEACGTYVPAADSAVKIRIYRSKDNHLMAQKDMTVTNAGYYTIPLGDASFDMEKGSEYKVEIQTSYQSGGNTVYFYPFEVKDTTDDSFQMDCIQGQSEISYAFGDPGTDVTSVRKIENCAKTGNALIKLYSTEHAESGGKDHSAASEVPKVTTTAAVQATTTASQKATTAATNITYTKPYLSMGAFHIYKGNKANVAVKNKVSGVKVSFSSSNNSVATVNSKGSVTGKKAGTATITAKVTQQGKSYSLRCKVKVSNKRLAFTKKKAKIKKKKSYSFKVKKYGVTGKVRWKVSNKKLASIGKTSGKLKAKKKKGRVKVTAYCGKFKVSYTVKIY